MKVSSEFKKAIQGFIDTEKTLNPDFLEATKKEDRNIDDCCNYILNTVQKLGHNAMADHEVFDIVSQYYFAEKIEKPKPVEAKVSHVPDKKTSQEKPKPAAQKIEKPKTPAELLAEEGITEEFMKTLSTATHGSKVILKPGLPVYSLLKSKDSYFVYDENDNILKDEKNNNLKISHKEGIIALARYILSIKK